MALSRRRFFTAVLIAAFGTGALLTQLTDKHSRLYELGAVLGLASLTIGSFVVFYFAKKRAPMVATPPDFEAGAPFVPHVRLQITALRDPKNADAAPAAVTLDAHRYYLMLGTEGFSVRVREDPAAPGAFDAQFLRPDVSLPRFAAEGTAFRVFDGARVVAEGAVTTRSG